MVVCVDCGVYYCSYTCDAYHTTHSTFIYNTTYKNPHKPAIAALYKFSMQPSLLLSLKMHTLQNMVVEVTGCPGQVGIVLEAVQCMWRGTDSCCDAGLLGGVPDGAHGPVVMIVRVCVCVCL